MRFGSKRERHDLGAVEEQHRRPSDGVKAGEKDC